MESKTFPSVSRVLGLFWFLSIGVPPAIVLAQSEVQIGYGAFDLGGAGGTPSIAALFRLENPDGILVSEAGVGAAKAMSEGRIFVQQDSTRMTGLAMVNRSDHSETVELDLRDSAGAVTASRQVTLAPGEHRSRFVHELLSGVPANFLGSLTFRATSGQGQIAAVTLRQSMNSFGEPVFTTLPVAELAADGGQEESDRLVMPEIGAGLGLTTQLILISRSATSSKGTIHLFDSDGHPLTLAHGGKTSAEFDFQLAGGGVLFSVFGSPDPAQVGVGYATVTVEEGDVLPAGSAVFRYEDAEGQVISEAGVGALEDTKQARMMVDQFETRTGLALANAGNAPNRVDFRLLDAGGRMLDSASRILPAGGHLQIFADELFQLENGFCGMLEIESPQPVTPITLKLTMNDRQKPIVTTLPVSYLGVSNSGESAVVPQMAFGDSEVGAFSTRLIFLPPRTDETCVGRLGFQLGEGVPWEMDGLPSHFPFALGAGELGILDFRTRPDPIVISPGKSASAVITSTGGSIRVVDDSGAEVKLRIPPFALAEPATISVTLLGQNPRHNFTRTVYPGVLLEPAGLALRRPARLEIRLPSPVDNPELTRLVWLASPTHVRALGNQIVQDDSIEGDILHFSAFSWEGLTLSEAARWAASVSMMTPEDRARLGFPPLPEPVLEALDMVERVNWLIEAEKELSPRVSTDFLESAWGVLEQAALHLLGQPVPSDPCGPYHSYLRELAGVFSRLGDEEIDSWFAQRIAAVDQQCIRIDLTGRWRLSVSDLAETCRIISGRGGSWEEGDDDFQTLVDVVQNGSTFESSFPAAPEAGTFAGSLQATGVSFQPYFFTVSNSGSATLDCQEFFETTDFGSPICNVQFAPCVPLVCYESDELTAGVSSDGRDFLGLESWDFQGQVRETREQCDIHGKNCSQYTVVVKYRCQGSAQFSGHRLQ